MTAERRTVDIAIAGRPGGAEPSPELRLLRVALEVTDAAVLGVDSDGRVVLASRAAEALLDATAHASLRDGSLSLHDPEARRELALLLNAPEGRARADGCVFIETPEPGLMLRVVRGDLRPGGHHLVFLSSTRRQIQPSVERLGARFRLTPTEARIASELAQGHDLGAIAERLGVRRSTVRTHMKHLREKTKTQRQADLVRLILSVEPWFL